jgi:FlaA1/EpsC-like NDP-sugar epimerase
MMGNYESKILVSGAFSFIGKQLIKYLLAESKSKIIACHRSSDHESINDPALIYEITDLLDFTGYELLFNKYRPDYVFHLAAITRLSPAEENPLLALRTNYFGTKMLADLCIKYSVRGFMAASSNLAREPESVVGLTKYLSEKYLRNNSSRSCKMVSFRMPNVPGSPGSVTELFKRQILSGGPLTLTDARMERRFLNKDKAAELLVYSLRTSSSGDVFVMRSKNTNIKNLAEGMIKQSGKNISIKFIGAKAGEKLVEQKYKDNEIVKTNMDDLAVLKNDWQKHKIDKALQMLGKKSENFEFKLMMKKLKLSLRTEKK